METNGKKSGRLFCGTDYLMDCKFWDSLRDVIQYFYAGDEICPTTKRKHWQYWVFFKKKIRQCQANKYVKGTGAIFMCNGSINDQVKYTTKDGKCAHEFGIPPSQGRRTDLLQIRDEIKNGASELDIFENNFALACQYGRPFNRYRELIEKKRNWETIVRIRWGDAGAGKTRYVLELDKPFTRVYWDGKFIGNYNGEDHIFFDEVKWDMFDPTFFNDICDRYACQVRVIGGFRNWKPRVIYFCSNQCPANFMKKAGVARRIDSVDYCKFVPDVPEVV